MSRSSQQLILKPTFPLDHEEIKLRSRHLKLAHPFTWGGFSLALIGPFLAADGMAAGFFGAFVCVAIVGIALSAFWSGRESRIEAQVVEEMIAESNADQDRRLSAIVNHYRQRGQHQYATALGKFLLLKKAIEKRIHPEGTVLQVGEQIERLVDTLCAAVCREFDKITLLDSKLGDILISGDSAALTQIQSERSEVLAAIMRAYSTLYESLETVVELDNMAEKTTLPEITRSQADVESHLGDTVEKLKEEIELARRIRDRLSIPESDADDADFQMFGDDFEEEKNT